jgi:hypothetical protein
MELDLLLLLLNWRLQLLLLRALLQGRCQQHRL